MKITILWEHHDFDGIDNSLYPYGIYKFVLPVKEKGVLKDLLKGKNEDKIEVDLLLNDDTLSVLTYLFKTPSDYATDCLVIYPEENIQHIGYLEIKENKKLIFYPITKKEIEEVEELEKKAITKIQ